VVRHGKRTFWNSRTCIKPKVTFTSICSTAMLLPLTRKEFFKSSFVPLWFPYLFALLHCCLHSFIPSGLVPHPPPGSSIATDSRHSKLSQFPNILSLISLPYPPDSAYLPSKTQF
jgi:hypothetical protein